MNLAPLYATKDRAQAQLSEGLREFEQKVQEYEALWLAVYEWFIADPEDKPDFPSYTQGSPHVGSHTNLTDLYYVGDRRDLTWLKSANVSVREEGEGWRDVSLTILQKELSDAERAIVRAVARNEKAQSEAKAYGEEASAIGIAVTNARIAVVNAYKEHGISEGRAGAIFRFTDSGEDAVTYTLSLVALNQQANANLSDFKSALASMVETLHSDIQAANEAHVSALSQAEDVRYSSSDTDAEDKQDREDWDKVGNLRNRIIMLDSVIMLAGWGDIDRRPGYVDVIPGFACQFDRNGYRTARQTGRDEYIRKYWNKEQPIDRTYTKERLVAVESVLDNLEGWLQDRIDYWEKQGRNYEQRLIECERALHGSPHGRGLERQGVREWRQAIIAETTPIPGE